MTQMPVFRIFLIFFIGFSFFACGEDTKNDEGLVLGNWTQYRNRAYILLIVSPTGSWNSSVRIADVTSKIVESKGDAKGVWHLENGQLVFTVTESDIEDVWEKNATRFFEVVELGQQVMLLREENGRMAEWKKTSKAKASSAVEAASLVLPMKPIAVNLNKISSNTKDRYLCLNMSLVLKELMPEEEVPKLHPKARDAAILFLSSLVYGDVKDFDLLKVQNAKLLDVLNPYMGGAIKEVKIDHVIVASTIEKVQEFIIEHTMIPEAPGEPEEGGENGDKAKETS